MNIKTLSRQLQPTGNTAQPTDQFGSDEARAGQDHYSALARMVAEISQDHSQLRAFIYEYARVKLRKELYPKFLDGAWSEVNQQVRELEDAIDKIETDFRGNAARLRSDSHPALLQGTDASLPALQRGAQRTTTFGDEAIQARSLLLRSPAYDSSRSPIVWERDDRLANAFLGKHLRSTFWRNTQLVIAAALGLAIFAAINTQSVLNRLVDIQAGVGQRRQQDRQRTECSRHRCGGVTDVQPAQPITRQRSSDTGGLWRVCRRQWKADRAPAAADQGARPAGRNIGGHFGAEPNAFSDGPISVCHISSRSGKQRTRPRRGARHGASDARSHLRRDGPPKNDRRREIVGHSRQSLPNARSAVRGQPGDDCHSL